MYITKEEEKMLDGEYGRLKQSAMDFTVKFGDLYNAEETTPISCAHVAGISLETIFSGGVRYFRGLDRICREKKEKTKFSVPTTLNPCALDLEKWRRLGFSNRYLRKQLSVTHFFERLGGVPIYSCTPYLVGHAPKKGETIAWAESSAVLYANSVLGARTNKESGPTSFYAALTGRCPKHGLLLDENRVGTHLIKVVPPMSSSLDFSLLGYVVGKKLHVGCPVFEGLKGATAEDLKALCAGVSTGHIGLIHILGVTPEAEKTPIESLETIEIDKEELNKVKKELSTVTNGPDLVAIGCPHVSTVEVKEICAKLKGRKIHPKIKFWICAPRGLIDLNSRSELEKAGVEIVCDTCMVVSPLHDLGIDSVVTNSSKAAYHICNMQKIDTAVLPLDECIDIALRGKIG